MSDRKDAKVTVPTIKSEIGFQFGACVTSVEVALGLRVEGLVIPQKRVKVIVPPEIGNELQAVLDKHYKSPNELLGIEKGMRLRDMPEVVDKRKI